MITPSLWDILGPVGYNREIFQPTQRQCARLRTSGATDLSNTANLELTEHQGSLLALLLRTQPATAHQLYKLCDESPTASINASKGQLYPAIRRLKELGFLDAERVAGDARGTEELRVSALGVEAVRAWVLQINSSHVVLDDPLRTRVLSFDLLSREEQLVWIAKAKELVKTKRHYVDAFNDSVDLPYKDFAYLSATTALAAKTEALDELLFQVASDK